MYFGEHNLEQQYNEIPANFIPVHIQINRSSLEDVLTHGLDAQKAKVFKKLKPQEELMEKTRIKLGIRDATRQGCIFAYPTTNTNEQRIFGMHTDAVTIAAYVDPEKCWVVDADLYTYMSERVMWEEPEEAEKFAQMYWETRVKLSEYIKPSYEKRDHFMYPEVLIQQPTIDSKLIKVL